MSKIILVVDIETSGFLNQGGKIVEIGIVKLNLNTGVIKPVFDSLIKEPGLDLSHTMGQFGWIFKNSNLKYDELTKAPSLEDCRVEIQSLFDSYQATAYNKEFDFDFLKDRGFIINELPCPMLLATPILKIKNKNRYGSFKWPNVEEAWRFFFGNTGYVEAHRAIDDAVHEAKIVHQLYRMDQFVVSSICLEARFREMYRDESDKPVFVYSVCGTFEELLVFKETQGSNYISDKDGTPLFLSQRILSFDKKNSIPLIVHENGQIVADYHEKILERKSTIEKATQNEKLRNEKILQLKSEINENSTNQEINHIETPDIETYNNHLNNSEPRFEHKSLIPVEHEGRWGYCDIFGNIVITCKYESARHFLYNDIAAVKLEGKYGYINQFGEVIIPFIYEDASFFSEGLAYVTLKGWSGFIDCNNNKILNTRRFTYIESFLDGLAIFCADDKWGFINRNGQEVSHGFDDMFSFSCGLALVKKNGKSHFIDRWGNILKTKDYDELYSFSEDLAVVSFDEKYGLIDIKGNRVVPLIYDSIGTFRDGFASVVLNDKMGFINIKGQVVIPIKYKISGDLDGYYGRSSHLRNGKLCIIDAGNNEYWSE